jgi:micrococcal nuclease
VLVARKSASKKRRLLSWLLTAILIAAILTIRLVEEIGPEREPADRFTVTAVIDGDTVELTGGDKLRLLAVDTPESGEPFYEEARSFLAELTLGKTARIEFANLRRDRYGRLLAYLYIDSLFVNEAIIENGLGNLYLFRDSDLERPETKRMLSAQRRALEAGLGIWAVGRMAEEYYRATNSSFRFHRPGCRAVMDLPEGRYRSLKTREEALREGLSPCRNCRP